MGFIEVLKKAKDNKYAVGQFNVSTDEQIKAIVEVADDLKSPIIIGTSESEREFLGEKQAVALVKTWQKQTNLPIVLNADHCKSFESAKSAIDAGYSGVHFDGAVLSFKENIEQTKRVVDYAKKKNKNILVEGELGRLPGSSIIHQKKTKIKIKDLTGPDQAKEFVEKTKVDSLAVIIGNMHGVESDFKNPPLYLDRLGEIQQNIPDVFLVLHGGSGTSKQDIKKAIKLGIVKININTELRIAYSNALREFLKQHPDQIKPYQVFPATVKAMKKVVMEKIKLFGSFNKVVD